MVPITLCNIKEISNAMSLLLADRKKNDQASNAFQPGEGTPETWPNICSGLALNSHLYKDNIRIIK
jgi:hypothetical protein